MLQQTYSTLARNQPKHSQSHQKTWNTMSGKVGGSVWNMNVNMMGRTVSGTSARKCCSYPFFSRRTALMHLKNTINGCRRVVFTQLTFKNHAFLHENYEINIKLTPPSAKVHRRSPSWYLWFHENLRETKLPFIRWRHNQWQYYFRCDALVTRSTRLVVQWCTVSFVCKLWQLSLSNRIFFPDLALVSKRLMVAFAIQCGCIVEKPRVYNWVKQSIYFVVERLIGLHLVALEMGLRLFMYMYRQFLDLIQPIPFHTCLIYMYSAVCGGTQSTGPGRLRASLQMVAQ